MKGRGLLEKKANSYQNLCLRIRKFATEFKEIIGCSTLIWTLWFLQLDRPGWFDEFAVLANSTKASGITPGKSLDWLQSVPVGYYVLADFAVDLPQGHLILRVISALSVFAAALLIVRIGRNLPKYLQSALLVGLCINPIVSTYALAAKPYAVEILIGTAGYFLVQRRRHSLFFALIILGTPFTGSLVTFELILIAIVLIQKPVRRYFLLSTVFVICIYIMSRFTSIATQEVMKNSWFGQNEATLIKRLISGVGNFLWLPVSGLGILPENGSGDFYFYLSGLLIVCILVSIILVETKTPGKYIIFGNASIAVVLQGFQLLPAAGRLLLPLTFVIWLELMFVLKALKTWIGITACTLMAVLFIHQQLASLPQATLTSEKRVLAEILSKDLRIYSTQDFAPLVQYAEGRTNRLLSPNLLITKEGSGFLGSCRDLSLEKGDILIVPNEISEVKSSNLQLLAHENFFMYKVVKEFTIDQSPLDQSPLNCDYTYGNPSKPLLN
jgi:hypothetical protein